MRIQPCVLFFDEFDALGKERGDAHKTGEIKRVISFLLMQFDQTPSYVVGVAATSHAELLDRAVWRRFQLRLEFPAPDRSMVAASPRRTMDAWPDRPSARAEDVADRLGPLSYAEALDFCQNVRRRQILGLDAVPNGERRPGGPNPGTKVSRRSQSDQERRFGPIFQRLADVLSRDIQAAWSCGLTQPRWRRSAS